jgi:transglutaminase-like putative cysteine protease
MNIPARCATGYLGNIGVPKDPAPMDFSAWFEAYLDGPAGPRWYTLDARHNRPRIGRIVMAYGRDATDCAITPNFGPSPFADFTVGTDGIDATV